MKRILSTIPRKVLISLGSMTAMLALLVVLIVVLGGARDEAISRNIVLTDGIANTRTQISQSRTDHDFVTANLEKYETLMKSDRLVPHTRRTAVVELQRLGRERGLTDLTYNFAAATADSPLAATSQPNSSAYRVSIESIDLRVAAPLDGAIYGFLTDIHDSFPGAVVLSSAVVRRLRVLNDQELQAVSAGSARIVTGEVKLLWRTAQAQEQPDGAK
jgi:hypothetical protein